MEITQSILVKTVKLKKQMPYIIAFYATIVRYYDYAIFGLSASMLSKNFMPGDDDNYQMLVFFAVFGVSMLARPFGSIIFGKIGDLASRITSVKISMILAIISTSLVAFIPSFDSIGWYAVILLTLCRMLFLASLVGEMDAIKIYVAEKIGQKRRCLAIGIVSFSAQIGVLLASVMYHVVISFEDIKWLWKINFLLGGVLGLFAVMMRGYLQESDVFLKSKLKTKEALKHGIITNIADNKMKFMLAVIINGMIGGGYNFLVIFLGTFAANIADVISPEKATFGNIILISLYGLACVISGYLSDRICVAKQLIVALVLTILCTVTMMITLFSGNFENYLHYLLAFLVPFYIVPVTVKIQSLFLTSVRMRMYSLSHSVGSLIFSSTTPFICMSIWLWSKSFRLVLGYFLLQLIILFLALMILLKKNYNNMFET